MPSDKGGNTVGAVTEFNEDDYIWLAGRPVVIIRNRFTTGWVRHKDQYEDPGP